MTRRNRTLSIGVCALALSALAAPPSRLAAQAPGEIQKAVDAAYAKFRTL